MLANRHRQLGVPTWRPKLSTAHDTVARPIQYSSSLLAIPQEARMASLSTAVRSTPKIARSALQQRSLSDVAITRTGKPILRVQGGRLVQLWMLPRARKLTCAGQVITWRYERLDGTTNERANGSLITIYRTHCDGLRCNGTAGTIHRQQIGYEGSLVHNRRT